MKKLIVLTIALLALPVALLAQTEPTQPPASWGDVFSNPALWLGSFAGVSLLTAFLAAIVNGLLKVVAKWPKQFVAWAVAVIILVVGDVGNIKLIYTWDFPWWLAVLNGLAAGLAANGVFDIPILKALLDKIDQLFNKPKT